MNARRDRILQVLSSIAVGIMAFCLSFPAAMIFGALLIRPLQGDAFFSPQEVNLVLVSIFVGTVVAVFAGTKYDRHQKYKNGKKVREGKDG